jgi:hypothetical protein
MKYEHVPRGEEQCRGGSAEYRWIERLLPYRWIWEERFVLHQGKPDDRIQIGDGVRQ